MLYAKKVLNKAIPLAIASFLTISPGCSWADTRIEGQQPANVPANAAWNFDDVPVGKLPPGWNAQATNPKGPLAIWQVIRDATAPSSDHVLAMTNSNHTSGGTFNLCWTNTASFLNGEIEVRFKAVKGEEDQGGGVIWRALDKDNYYIARFNPLEDNFRLYTVRNGHRKTLADARIALSAGRWHSLRIVQNGKHYEGYLDRKKLLDGTDGLFSKPGGVGVWTKADAVTSFDDFSVRHTQK